MVRAPLTVVAQFGQQIGEFERAAEAANEKVAAARTAATEAAEVQVDAEREVIESSLAVRSAQAAVVAAQLAAEQAAAALAAAEDIVLQKMRAARAAGACMAIEPRILSNDIQRPKLLLAAKDPHSILVWASRHCDRGRGASRGGECEAAGVGACESDGSSGQYGDYCCHDCRSRGCRSCR